MIRVIADAPGGLAVKDLGSGSVGQRRYGEGEKAGGCPIALQTTGVATYLA